MDSIGIQKKMSKNNLQNTFPFQDWLVHHNIDQDKLDSDEVSLLIIQFSFLISLQKKGIIEKGLHNILNLPPCLDSLKYLKQDIRKLITL